MRRSTTAIHQPATVNRRQLTDMNGGAICIHRGATGGCRPPTDTRRRLTDICPAANGRTNEPDPIKILRQA